MSMQLPTKNNVIGEIGGNEKKNVLILQGLHIIFLTHLVFIGSFCVHWYFHQGQWKKYTHESTRFLKWDFVLWKYNNANLDQVSSMCNYFYEKYMQNVEISSNQTV